MAAKKQKGRREPFHFNIGAVIFGALLVYLLITVIIYFVTDRQEIYQVTIGTLSQNSTYNAIALRDETICQANEDGYVNFLIADGRNASQNEAVCAVSDTPADEQKQELDAEDLSDIQTLAEKYARSYDRNQYSSVYDFSFSINSFLYKTSSESGVSGNTYSADQSGIVVYSSDGYEGKDADTITESDFNSKTYHKQQIESDAKVGKGDTLFKIITDTNWSVVIQLDDAQKEQLSELENVRVRFAKDGKSETGSVRLFDNEGSHFAEITFSSGMVRYCNERFLNVELVTNTQTGLKIPRSAVVSKEFYRIPKEYATKGGDDNSTGFLKEIEDENGEKTTSFVDATIYGESTPENSGDTVYYYVSKKDFDKGDVLVRADSSDRFTVSDTESLTGVFCTNKGYAVFRRVEILEQDNESCIVAEDVSYSLSQYDFIVRNGKEVNESDIIKQAYD
ncbi:MAG: HlyD family efflux transporter periplasmic adaptor subunit [Bilifractor sp.]